MKVVVVEDEPDISTLYAEFLRGEHFDVTCINRPDQALVDAVWRDVDVAIVDLMMPRVSGDEVLRWLIEHHPRVRRIIASAVDITPDIAALADTVLRKPFSPEAVLEAVG